jgi:hypothetical protein
MLNSNHTIFAAPFGLATGDSAGKFSRGSIPAFSRPCRRRAAAFFVFCHARESSHGKEDHKESRQACV